MEKSHFKKLKRAWLASTASLLVSASVCAQDAPPVSDAVPATGKHDSSPQVYDEGARKSLFDNLDEGPSRLMPPPSIPLPSSIIPNRHDNQAEEKTKKPADPQP